MDIINKFTSFFDPDPDLDRLDRALMGEIGQPFCWEFKLRDRIKEPS